MQQVKYADNMGTFMALQVGGDVVGRLVAVAQSMAQEYKNIQFHMHLERH